MQLTGLPLDQGWVGQLPIEVPIHRPTEAETGINVANPWPMQSIVIADGDRQRPSGSRPTGLPPLQLLLRRGRIRRKAKAVENHRQSPTRQAAGLDGAVVVGQRSGLWNRPGVAVIRTVTSVDLIREATAKELKQSGAIPRGND